MDWFLCQWNERSFPGWKTWWQQVMLVAFGYVLLQSWLGSTGVAGTLSLAVFLRTVFLVGAGWLGLAMLTASIRVFSWRAAIAGWSRLLPVVLCVPVIDALVRWLTPAFVRGHGWFGPTDILGWLAMGWVNDGFASVGLTLLIWFFGVAMVLRLRRSGVRLGKAVVFGALVVGCAWLVLAVPSFAAWTRLSTYGTTFAPAERVVEQAFIRVWSKSHWYDQVERFLDVRMMNPQLAARFVFATLSWLLAFGLLAPLLSRARFASWKDRVQEMGVVVAPVLGGVVLGLTRVVGQALFASVVFGVAIVSVLALLSRYLRRSSVDEDPDERWMTLAMLVSGVFLLGWMPLLLLVAALVVYSRATLQPNWWRQAGYRGSAWTLLFFFGWAVMTRTALFLWSPALIIGVFGVFIGLSFIVASQADSDGDKTLIIGSKGISRQASERVVLLGWLVSIGLLWWGVGQLAFGGAALVLALLAPAALWLIPLEGKRATVAIFLLPTLLGLLLHPGIFLP